MIYIRFNENGIVNMFSTEEKECDFSISNENMPDNFSTEYSHYSWDKNENDVIIGIKVREDLQQYLDSLAAAQADSEGK